MAAQAQSNAVATIEPQQNTLSGAVRGMEKQFALALPEHVSPEKFVRVVVTAIQSNPDLQRADRDSVLGAALKCAQDGLVPDGREAALVVYNTKVKVDGRDTWIKAAQYMPMIAGVLAKVRRSGELLTIGAHIVYEKDSFTYVLGDEERIEHQPFLGGARGKPIAAYAVAKTKDGGIYREVMSIEEIEQVRSVSRAKDRGPWVDWWGEMARKTVLRRLSKRLPMSTDLVQLFDRDNDHYDLTRAAQGAATLRRLHADFDEPAPELIEHDPKSPSNRDASAGGEASPEAGPQAEASPAGTGSGTPADREGHDPKEDGAPALFSNADEGEERFGFSPEGDDFDLEGWARQIMDAMPFKTAADIDAFFADPEACKRYERLNKDSPTIAKQLVAALNGRKKAMAAKDRAQ